MKAGKNSPVPRSATSSGSFQGGSPAGCPCGFVGREVALDEQIPKCRLQRFGERSEEGAPVPPCRSLRRAMPVPARRSGTTTSRRGWCAPPSTKQTAPQVETDHGDPSSGQGLTRRVSGRDRLPDSEPGGLRRPGFDFFRKAGRRARIEVASAFLRWVGSGPIPKSSGGGSKFRQPSQDSAGDHPRIPGAVGVAGAFPVVENVASPVHRGIEQIGELSCVIRVSESALGGLAERRRARRQTNTGPCDLKPALASYGEATMTRQHRR